MLEIEGVSKIYRTGFWLRPSVALEGVSFTVGRGRIFGFLGANGAGKTSLIQLIVGHRRPDRGAIRIGGQVAGSVEARRRVGYLPERPYFHEHLTGTQLLEYFGALSGLRKRDVRSRIPACLARVGLAGAGDRELRHYSKGMLQRIGIAQAILHNPELLVLDEPMSGLDPMGRKEMRELIRGFGAEGKTVFFSSHIVSDVEALCQSVALIKKGKILHCGEIGELLDRGGSATRVEIAFRGTTRVLAAEAELEDLEELPAGGGWRAWARGQERADASLKRLLERGAKVLWVSPLRPSLEDLFE